VDIEERKSHKCGLGMNNCVLSVCVWANQVLTGFWGSLHTNLEILLPSNAPVHAGMKGTEAKVQLDAQNREHVQSDTWQHRRCCQTQKNSTKQKLDVLTWAVVILNNYC